MERFENEDFVTEIKAEGEDGPVVQTRYRERYPDRNIEVICERLNPVQFDDDASEEAWTVRAAIQRLTLLAETVLWDVQQGEVDPPDWDRVSSLLLEARQLGQAVDRLLSIVEQLEERADPDGMQRAAMEQLVDGIRGSLRKQGSVGFEQIDRMEDEIIRTAPDPAEMADAFGRGEVDVVYDSEKDS